MGDTTRIEWAHATWNPVTGCTRVSPGCANCYIDWSPTFRVEGRHFLDRDGNRSHEIGATTGVRLHSDRLDWPLRKRSWRGKRVFVCSMADLFHDQVPDDYIARVFAVMALTPETTYQVLTKRPARMRALLSSPDFREAVIDHVCWYDNPAEVPRVPWPLPNVHIGVSVEDQKAADLRIPLLLDHERAVRTEIAAERDRARDFAVQLEAENARLRAGIAELGRWCDLLAGTASAQDEGGEG